MRKLLIVLGVVLALIVTACGGDGGEDAQEPGVTGVTGGTAPTGDGANCVDLTGEGVAFTIRLEKNEFVPNCFTASASQGITIVNADTALHNFTIQDTPIDVDIPPGDEFNGEPITGVVDPGLYVLVCKYHLPGMVGEITVVA
ncbi:MAG: cupredoxin domain-containing protein [Actinomycetota bacterium]